MIRNYKLKELEKFTKPNQLTDLIGEFNKILPNKKISISSLAKKIKSDPQSLRDVDNCIGKYESVFNKIKKEMISLLVEIETKKSDDPDESLKKINKAFDTDYPTVRYKDGNVKYHYLNMCKKNGFVTNEIELEEIGTEIGKDKSNVYNLKDLMADNIYFEVGENYPYEDEKKEQELIVYFCEKFKELNKLFRKNFNDFHENIEISFTKKNLLKECKKIFELLCKKNKSVFWAPFRTWQHNFIEDYHGATDVFASSTVSIIVFGNLNDVYRVKIDEGQLPPDYPLDPGHCDVEVDGQNHNDWLKKNYGK